MDEEIEKGRKAYLKHMEGSVAAFAPGRIEFLGNHLDYNGGMVLGAAIDAGIYVLANPRRDKGLRLFSESFEDEVVETSLDQFRKIEGKGSWANYCLGVLKAMQERGLAPSSGFSLTFVSNLPVSAGLSSSAALELATGLALAQLADREVGLEELVGICREAENDFVGMPCGILDQASSALGRPDHLVLIDCRNESFSTLPLPPRTALWIIDSGIKHDLVDSHYSARHAECGDALRLVKEAGSKSACLAECREEEIDKTDLSPNLRKRAVHVAREQKRVLAFRDGLLSNRDLGELGRLLTDSHWSSSRDFENSCPELDFLVERLTESDEVLGARLTGGGFGGAVLAWTTSSFSRKEAEAIAGSYKEEYGALPSVHSFSPSRGARIEDWPPLALEKGA